MKKAIWIAAVLLALLHQDFWWWDDGTLVFGFLPVGLAYHVAYTVAAACLWGLASKFAWPDHIEEFANGADKKSREGKAK